MRGFHPWSFVGQVYWNVRFEYGKLFCCSYSFVWLISKYVRLHWDTTAVSALSSPPTVLLNRESAWLPLWWAHAGCSHTPRHASQAQVNPSLIIQSQPDINWGGSLYSIPYQPQARDGVPGFLFAVALCRVGLDRTTPGEGITLMWYSNLLRCTTWRQKKMTWDTTRNSDALFKTIHYKGMRFELLIAQLSHEFLFKACHAVVR